MRRRVGVLTAAALTAGVLATAVPATASLATGEAAASTGHASTGHASTGHLAAVRSPGPVHAHPVTTTPHLAPNDNPAQQIRQIVQCKGTMFAVGTFTTIEQGSKHYTRHNVVSFSAEPPYKVSSWAPAVNGEVNSITFSGGRCGNAYIGGTFTSINGTAVHNIAELSTSTGAVIKTFGHGANGTVNTLLGITAPRGGPHILAGGYYTSINDSTADPYMTSLSPVTGKDDRYISLRIHGNYVFPGVGSNPTRVYNQALSHSGRLDLVMGDFRWAGPVRRQQIFMLAFGPKQGRVTGWTSPEFDGSEGNLPGGYPYQCFTDVAFYVRAAAWSPDDSTTPAVTRSSRSRPTRARCTSPATSAGRGTRTAVTRRAAEP